MLDQSECIAIKEASLEVWYIAISEEALHLSTSLPASFQKLRSFIIFGMEKTLLFSPDARQTRWHGPESPFASTQPFWTTARCNRLLRPLSSKIALLRKAQELDALKDSVKGRDVACLPFHTTSSRGNIHSNCQKASTLNTHSLSGDPSPRPRKRVRRTYSSKEGGHGFRDDAKKNQVDAILSLSQNIQIKNPSLLDLKNDKRSAVPLNGLLVCKNGAQVADICARDLLRQRARSMGPDRWKLYEGIQTGFDALLKATQTTVPTTRTGARSLFSTCLRKIPGYIADQEQWSKMQNPDNSVDVASNVYTELVTFGTSLEGGWKPLKEVVRAHGVAMIESAVRDGVINCSIASTLIILCIHRGAIDEAQQLVECVISTLKFVPRPAGTHDWLFSNSSLSILNYFALQTGRYGFLFRQLSRLFNDGTIPIEWISCGELAYFWSEVLRSIKQDDCHSNDAAALFQTAVFRSYGFPTTAIAIRLHTLRLRSKSTIYRSQLSHIMNSDKLPKAQDHPPLNGFRTNEMAQEMHKTSLDLLAMLVSQVFTQNPAPTSDLVTPQTSLLLLQNMAVQAHQFGEIERLFPKFCKSSSSLAESLFFLFLAAATSSASNTQADSNLYHTIDQIRSTNLSNEFPDKAATFLCKIAESCGRTSCNESFLYIQQVVSQFMRIYNAVDADGIETGRFIGKIGATIAVRYSVSTGIPRHLSWAMDIKSYVDRATVGLDRQTPGKTPTHKSAKTKLGFRWEEGICEWVAGTPIFVTPKAFGEKDEEDSSSRLLLTDSLTSASMRTPARTRASICLREALPTSIKMNSSFKSPEILNERSGKTCHGEFVRIEIPSSNHINNSSTCQVKSRSTCKVTRNLARQAGFDVEVEELSNLGSSQERVVNDAGPVSQATSRDGVRGGNGARKVDTGFTKQTVETQTEALDSDDELSLS